MAQFTITITDAGALAGITKAREAKNAALTLSEGEKLEEHPEFVASDNDYVQFVMASAAQSYTNQYGVKK